MRSISIAIILLCTIGQAPLRAQAQAASPAASQAQAANAILQGKVTDSSGAVIAQATVTVTSAGGESKTATSDAEGKFTVTGLTPGAYNITVSAPKFADYKAEAFNIEAGDQNLLEAQLQAAGEVTSVNVTAETAAQIETEKSELAGTISQKQVTGFGLNGRNFSALITLSPGVSNQTQQDEAKVGVVGSAKYSVNGGRVEYNTFDVDGSDVLNTGIAASRGHPTLSVYPSVDAISEIKILTSNYGAEYGKSASGTILVTTKSGGSQFHGNAYEFLRNEYFNARGFKDPAGPAPLYRRNDLGFTIGGPLFIPKYYNTTKDKTFFFYSEELRLERSPFSFAQAVPSLNEREGNFSDVCPAASGAVNRTKYPDCPVSGANGVNSAGTTFQSNQVPIDPNARAVLQTNTIPLANSATGCPYQLSSAVTSDPATWPCFNATVSPNTYWREELFRIDHNLNPSVKVSFRYIHDSWDTTTVTPQWQYGATPNSFPTVLNRFFGPGLSMVAHLTTVKASSSLVNDYSVSFVNQHVSLNDLPGPGANLARPARLDASCGSTISSCGMGSIFPVNGGKIPGINIGGSNAAYGGAGFVADTSFEPWKNSDPTITVRDDVNKQIGKHLVQAGVMFTDAQQSEQSSATGANTGNVQGLLTFTNVSNVVSTGNAFADFLYANTAANNNAPDPTGLLGQSAGEIVSYQQDSAQYPYSNHYLVLEPYLQDDWKIGTRLTVNLGLRLSLFGNWTPNGSHVFNFVPSKFSTSVAQNIQINGLYGYISSTATGQAIQANAQSPDPNTINGLIECGVNGVPSSCMTSHHFNPSPRVGFAWDPTGKAMTSIRAGYGVFFEHGTGDESNSGSLTGTPPLVQSMTQNAPQGHEFRWECIAGADAGCNPSIPAGAAYPLDVSAIPTKVIWPYVQQWSLSVQQQLNRDTVLSIAYVGSKGTHLATVRQLNQFDPVSAGDNYFGLHEPLYTDPNDTNNFQGGCGYGPVTPGDQSPFRTASGYRYYPNDPAYFNLEVACTKGVNPNSFRRYPGYGRVLSIENLANSAYHAFQLSLHHVHGPLDLGVTYTYGHSIDEASDRFASALGNSLDPKSNRASSDFDQRSILNISYIYALPFKQIMQAMADQNACPNMEDAKCRKDHPYGSAQVPSFFQKALIGWQLSGITSVQSGTPFSVINGGSGLISALDNAGVANGLGASSYPDIVRGTGHCQVSSGSTATSIVLGPLLGNRCEFVAPRALTFGNAGRNFLNNPRRTNFDMAVYRDFPLHEHYNIEARVEAFNVFNTEQYRIYNPEKGNTSSNTITCYGDATAGYSAGASSCDTGNSFLHPVDAHRPRTLQFGVKLDF
jgi:hypothetical protein